MKTKLLAKSTTGKDKFIELEVDGAYLITRWGYVDGKQQETKELCYGKNTGKANATTSEEQAILEYERKIKKKSEEGYVEESSFSNKTSDDTPDLHRLQKEFCPCKPIAKSPKDCLNGNYVADRKYNGVNIIITSDKAGDCHIYTRRIDDITEQLIQIPEIEEICDDMPIETMILVELVYFDENGKEFPEALRGLINKNRSSDDVLTYYNSLKGQLEGIIFDLMFLDGKFYGNEDFGSRREELHGLFFAGTVPTYQKFTQELIDQARDENWEGFVLRKEDSKIEYTMNGKAKRTGSWKWKFEETDDFIVLDAELGKGKHSGYFVRFKLGQYDTNGNIIDCGYCGSGKLTVPELKELYKDRASIGGIYTIKPYLVFEVLYRVRTKDGKLEFPVLQRIRDDKPERECVYNE